MSVCTVLVLRGPVQALKTSVPQEREVQALPSASLHPRHQVLCADQPCSPDQGWTQRDRVQGWGGRRGTGGHRWAEHTQVASTPHLRA